MTTRAWFRILRRSAWEGHFPHVTLYRRTDAYELTGQPLQPPIDLLTLQDLQRFVDTVLPAYAPRFDDSGSDWVMGGPFVKYVTGLDR